ncbi:poly(U)-binding-splicing factor PUF60-like isoform X2 [Dysidea avara]|uniref:poly(U)-binding-splicing factor PUF60-like isoform X2 n=1 Tax=Dysidea avara TaxID=196820 RepID=UPI003333FA53
MEMDDIYDADMNSPNRRDRRKKRGWDSTLPVDNPPPNTNTLPKLTDEQTVQLKAAKKYCLEATVRHNQTQRSQDQSVQMMSMQEVAQQQRALILMSRIYVGSINFELGEDTVRNGFHHFGTIKAINMSWDGAANKHKGYCFVEYETAEGAQLALEQMNGVVIGGRNIKVGRPNNVPQAAPIIARIQEEALKYPRIYVASIHKDLTETDVRSVFEAFGKIVSVELAPDTKPGKHRGWGFINYESHQASADAIASMNLFDLGGQFLRVGRALTPPLPLYPPNAAPIVPGLAPILPDPNAIAAANKAAARIQEQVEAMSAAQSSPPPPPPEPEPKPTPSASSAEKSSSSSDKKSSLSEVKAKLKAANEEKPPEMVSLQQEESVSISGSNARLMVMQRLTRKNESSVVVLRNMISVDEVDEELEDEVTSECSKFGVVERVVIYQERQGIDEDAEVIVKIFVVFQTHAEAEEAVKALNGRWFGGRVIKCEVYDDDKFQNNNLSH